MEIEDKYEYNQLKEPEYNKEEMREFVEISYGPELQIVDYQDTSLKDEIIIITEVLENWD